MAGNAPQNPRRDRPQRTTVSRFTAGLDRLAGRGAGRRFEGAVRRLLQGPLAVHHATLATRDPDPGLQRARTALATARTQMPGLLSGGRPVPAGGQDADGTGAADFRAFVTREPAPALELSAGGGALARLEEAILRLEDERRQLSAEVAALRLAAGELRETLLQLDERESYPHRSAARAAHIDIEAHAAPVEQREEALPPLESEEAHAALPGPEGAESKLDAAAAACGEAGDQEPEAEAWGEECQEVADAGIVEPSGSVGVCLRVASVAGSVALDAIHRSLTALTAVDTVRLLTYADGLAEFRVYLKQPLARARLMACVRQAAPSALVSAER